MMAPATQTHGTFDRAADMVRETAALPMLRAESMRLDLGFKLAILPLICHFVGFTLHFVLPPEIVWGMTADARGQSLTARRTRR